MKSLDPSVIEYVRSQSFSDRYAAYLRNTLLELAAINTAPSHDLPATARNEKNLFDHIEREIREISDGAVVCQRVPIDPAIADDGAYAPPGYAADREGQVPSVEALYADRSNMIVTVPGEQSDAPLAAILHAHVDVVSPWYAPRSAGDRVFGRGVCDNKAHLAILIAQIKLAFEMAGELGIKPPRGFVLHLPIDEEIGGNGSLALVRDPRFAGLPVLLLEPTDLVPYSAHRGAVYYRCKLSAGENPNHTALELFPFVVIELEKLGRTIQQETKGPLFSPNQIQTNHGVLGPYGRHPGNVCDHVAVELIVESNANPQRIGMKLIELMEEAVSNYIRLYGDLVRQIDPATGKPKLRQHFDLQIRPTARTQNFLLEVWGRAGHMGAVAQCDNAITKAAFLLGSLLRMAPKFPQVQARGVLPGTDVDNRQIVLEGGQGFSPSHHLADIQERMRQAAVKGVQKSCALRGRPFDPAMVEMTFDRLHSEPYVSSPDIAPMEAIKSAFQALGESWPTPAAWSSSCDARIYHRAGHPVAIFGAGQLEVCHSDMEYIDIPQMQRALAVTTLATFALATS